MADQLLTRLSDCIAAQMGLHFPPERWHDLERGLGAAARELAFRDATACAQWLTSLPWTKEQVEVVASHLTIGETYFFRESYSVQALTEHIVPAWVQARHRTTRHLRLWSAGCATGEEPYSLAMVLHTLLPDLVDWHITLLATDINRRFLQKASEGVYGAWSFRQTPQWLRARYFTPRQDGRYEIRPEIRQMVQFVLLNLLPQALPCTVQPLRAMDAIFCRNVLMYFSPTQAQRVVQQFYDALVEGGWLFVSPSETSHVPFDGFRLVQFPDLILYQKDSTTSRRVQRQQEDDGVLRQWSALPFPGEKAGVKEGEGTETMALLARLYANQGDLVAARHWVELVLAADKLNAGLHYLYATILQEQGDLDAAHTALQRVLYLEPRFVLAYVTLGHLARRQQRSVAAARYFEHAMALLSAYRPGDVLPEAEGMTVGHLMALIRTTTAQEAP